MVFITSVRVHTQEIRVLSKIYFPVRFFKNGTFPHTRATSTGKYKAQLRQ